MIITDIAGGLGNQCFQYAFGRRIAHRLGVPLKLDTSKIERYGLRPFRLGAFNIRAEMASPADLARLRARRDWCERLGIKPRHQRVHVREDSRRWFNPFDPRLLTIGDDTYLEGYWQSEKYFSDIAGEIRAELSLRTPPPRETLALGERLASQPSVAVHVRRGDYLTRPTAVEKFARCGLNYYERAFALIGERIGDARFFIFSDEPDWVREHFPKSPSVTVMKGAPAGCEQLDLWLMTQCRHHVIANSSFSWWGAWLCAHPEKIVIAPRTWFNLSAALNDRDARDRIPPGWIRL